MLAILLRSVILVPGLAALMLLLLGRVRAEPLPEAALYGLAVCEKPCWAGIVPGTTAFADVPDLIAQHQPEFTVLAQQLSAAPSYALQSRDFSGSIGASQRHVSAVRLQVPVPLWRMILLLGTPRCARLYGRRGGPRLLEVGWDLPPVVVWYNAQPGPHNVELAADSITLRLAGEVCTRFDERYQPNFARIQRFLR